MTHNKEKYLIISYRCLFFDLPSGCFCSLKSFTISILAVLSLGAHLFCELKGEQVCRRKDGSELAIETLEAVRGASDEKWQNLYDLTKGSANHHYPSQSSGKWVISNNGDETVAVNSIPYARYFVVDNVSRDQTPTSRAIENTYNSANDDPSTQKVTVTVTTNWATSTAVTFSQYLSRWRNKVTVQTSWTGGGGESSTNITTGSSLQVSP